MPSNDHQLYNPLDFDKHCIACHDLGGIPHGLNRSNSKDAVQSAVAKTQLQIAKDSLSKASENGELDDLGRPISKSSESILRSLYELQPRLETLLSDNGWCAKCHELASEHSEQIVLDSNLPKRWFQGAVFPHGDHLMVSCKSCHEQAFEESDKAVDSSKEASVVMIAGIDSCRACHISNPADRAEAFKNNQPFVAQAYCVDCHRYHVDQDPNIIRTNQTSHVLLQGDLDAIREYVMRGKAP